MADDESKRWDAFTPWELAAMDEFFQTFAPLRADSVDIQKIKQEIRATMQRRCINPLSPSAPETGPEVS